MQQTLASAYLKEITEENMERIEKRSRRTATDDGPAMLLAGLAERMSKNGCCDPSLKDSMAADPCTN